jgi:ATP-dependent Lon protease
MNKLIFILVISFIFECKAQIVDSVIVDGEAIAVQLLNEITLVPLHLNSSEKIKFHRLRRKVRKVYPFALAAKKQLLELKEDLNYTETRRQKRRIGKVHDKWIQEHFTSEIKKLTRSEGRVLIKLIHRETGNTAYDLVRNYRNGLTALVWQKLAKYFDGDLKATYNPEINSEDQWIEHILWEMRRSESKLKKTRLN